MIEQPAYKEAMTVRKTPDELRELLKVYLATDFPGRRPSTIHWAEQWTSQWLTWMKACHYTTVTQENLQRYVNHLFDRLSPNSASNMLIYVRRFLRWLESSGHCQLTPRMGIRTPKVANQPKAVPITRDEYMKLREVAAGHWMDWIIMLGWNTGMSMADCMGLRWENVDLEQGMISIHRRKTGTQAIIPFSPDDELGRAMAARADSAPHRQPEDFVSPDAGMRLRPNEPTISDVGRCAFYHIREAAGIPKGKTFHGLRHSFVSMLANSGMSTALASKVSGHLDPRVFSRYVHPNTAALRQGIADARAKAGTLHEVAIPVVERRYRTCKSYLFKPDTVYIVRRGRITLPDGSKILYVRSSENASGQQAVVVPCDEAGNTTSNLQLVVDMKDVSLFS